MIIIDTDNTFGIENCDIDDGLAIIYLISKSKDRILAISSSFGNNNLETVHNNTKKFLKDINKESIPLYKGGYSEDEVNEAAEFMVSSAREHKGKLSIVALGSLTNLARAYEIDNSFFENLKALYLMGGISKELIISGKTLNELNFSIDYKSAFTTLSNAKNIYISTGNTCLNSYLTFDDFQKFSKKGSFENWLYTNSKYWLDREKEKFNSKQIYLWDVFAASSLIDKRLFDFDDIEISPSLESLKTGLLIADGKKIRVKIPRLKNNRDFIKTVLHAFSRFNIDD